MAKYEARVKTKFGEIVFNFNSIDELKSNIDGLDVSVVSELLSKKFESVIVKEIRQPKPGCERIYRFSPSGLVEPIQIPKSKADTVALVLFAYHPEPASTEQVSLSTGIKDVASSYLTHTSYKKFWSKTQDGKYLLTQEGLEWVGQKIIPKLKAASELEIKGPKRQESLTK
jgi:hypothetical protein